MPQLPRLPKPGLPKPPSLSKFLRNANPLRTVIEDARESVRAARESIGDVASALRVEDMETVTEPESYESPATKKVEEGTVCTLCSMEHLHQAAGDLAEAMRFARDKGFKDPEAVRRVTHGLVELNEMERFDLSPSELEKLTPPERQLAEWALSKSRNLRHMINQAIMSRSVDDLNKAAAEAETVAQEFTQRLLDLPTTNEECQKCGELENLKTFLEKRREKGVKEYP